VKCNIQVYELEGLNKSLLGHELWHEIVIQGKDLVTTNDEKIFQFLHLISCMILHEKMHIIFAFISNPRLKHL